MTCVSSMFPQVAVKKMKRKFYYWEECVNLREVKVLYHYLITKSTVVIMFIVSMFVFKDDDIILLL